MPYSSKFTIYTAADPGSPGYLNGTTGSLISILNACLVNGYTGKPGAGWTKPLPDSASVYACYQQPTGSGDILFINDNAPNVANEAQTTGWETISSVCPAGASAATNVGLGLGQFPLPAQSLTYGSVVWRKSNTADSVKRYWIVAADSSSMYMWVQTGDSGANYMHTMFGDCYSLAGEADKWNCAIVGRYGQNSAATTGVDLTDTIIVSYNDYNSPSTSTAMAGHFIARSAFGMGTSINFNRKGDCILPSYAISGNPTYINGVLQTPNGPDNSLYMCPLYIAEPITLSLRGRFRGLYQVGHPYSSFLDGQLIPGGGQYAGKTFVIIRQSANNSFWALEVSNTVETN